MEHLKHFQFAQKECDKGDPAWEGKPRLRNLTLMFAWGFLLNQNLIFTTMARLQLDSLNFRWLETCRTTQFGRENPSLELTYAPGKWLVGRRDFLLGYWPIFRGDMGDMLVSRRENSTTLLLFCYVGCTSCDMRSSRTTLQYCDCLNTTQILDAWQCNFRHGVESIDKIHQMLYFYVLYLDLIDCVISQAC